jgi:ribonuclease HI
MKYDIYTDGSCVLSQNKGGYAFIMIDENGKTITEDHKPFKNTTNNRMELMAFLEGLLAAEKIVNVKDEITIYTDSTYISSTFEQGWYKTWLRNGWKTANRVAVKNTDLWRKILFEYDKLTKTIAKLSIIHIKSHVGITFNEYVDRQANLWRTADEKDFIIDQK